MAFGDGFMFGLGIVTLIVALSVGCSLAYLIMQIGDEWSLWYKSYVRERKRADEAEANWRMIERQKQCPNARRRSK